MCDKKIATKGDNVRLPLYAFFANKNDSPELLMEAATWWIQSHKLDYFVRGIDLERWLKITCDYIAVGHTTDRTKTYRPYNSKTFV